MTDLDDLRAELEDFALPKKAAGRSAQDERLLAGFEEIVRFVEEHGRLPSHGEAGGIFERLYAIRLDRLRALPHARELLEPLDQHGLLASGAGMSVATEAELSDEELLAELNVQDDQEGILSLKHVRSHQDKREAEEIAQRTRCEDFSSFKPLFEQVQQELKAGVRQTRPFMRDASIEQGNFFILSGQTVYVSEVGEAFKAPNGENDARLRVIYANGTESDILRRSLQRALYKDEAGRRITEPDAGPLFGETLSEGDIESGTIYVLRSLSDNPFVAEHRDLIHKIGVTGGKVETRIANAAHDATYLLADVQVVATYKLAGINRTKMEGLFHKIFANAQLDLMIQDRFGHPVKPREWFMVPLHVIDEAVDLVRRGDLDKWVYDPAAARFKNVP